MFQVYDRLHLEAIPHRFTVEAGQQLSGSWAPDEDGRYDLWVLGPNGFHRHFIGSVAAGPARPEVRVAFDRGAVGLRVALRNGGTAACRFELAANGYVEATATAHEVAPGSELWVARSLATSQGWYDFSATVEGDAAFCRRFAGRVETGRASSSDPEMHGTAIGDQYRRS